MNKEEKYTQMMMTTYIELYIFLFSCTYRTFGALMSHDNVAVIKEVNLTAISLHSFVYTSIHAVLTAFIVEIVL